MSNRVSGLGAVLVVGLSSAAWHCHANVNAPTIETALTIDALSQVKGGLRSGTRLLTNLDLSANWKLSAEWEAFGYVIADAGGGFSGSYSGDAQGLSNIDAPAGVRLFEAGFRRTSRDQKWVVAAGVLNANAMFDTQPYATTFLNASHGMGADLAQAGAPAFPYTSLGITAEWRVTDAFAVRSGLFDGVSGPEGGGNPLLSLSLSAADGVHAMVEAEHALGDGLVKVGYWRNTALQDRLDGAGKSRDREGIYIQVGAQLLRETNTDDQGLSAFIRTGRAWGPTVTFDHYLGAGVTYTGLIPGRDADQAGFAIARAHVNPALADAMGQALKGETTFEFTYSAAVLPGVIVQPDVQYVLHPAGDPITGNGLTVGLRLRIVP